MNSIEIGNVKITAKTIWYMGSINTTLFAEKDGLTVAQFSPYNINSKVKPENRNAVRALVKAAEASHVMTADDIARKEKYDRINSDYIKYTTHHNSVVKAMSV